MKKEETYKCIKDTPTGSYKAGEIYNDAMCAEFQEYFAKFKYTTHDGVDLYEGDKCCFLRSNGKISEMQSFWSSGNELLFSTREKAQAHIDEKNKPKFEVGKVYKNTQSGFGIMLCTSIKEGVCRGYGISHQGAWVDDGFFEIKGTKCIEATPAEWESALIKEAEMRGFKEGVKFIPVSKNALGDEFGTVGKMNKNIFDYFSEEVSGGLASMKNWVMRHGKWASIIQEHEMEKTTAEYLNDMFGQFGPSLADTFSRNNLIITKAPSHA